MDIHRCRFVPYPPSAINALAFSHTSTPNLPSKGPPNLRLAIGRANGDIELWNPLKGAWYQESIFRGGRDRSIEGLVWTQDLEDVDKNGDKIAGKLRLFSIGYSTAVTEWDLASGRPARHSAGNYGEIWCMAAQPKAHVFKSATNGFNEPTTEEAESQTQNIAVGCADGAIVLLNTTEGDLRFSRILARPSKKRSRVLSITFQNRHTIIAGHADSTIRIYDLRNIQQTRNMTLGAGPKGGPKETLVWSVKCLNDGTIVSGDSTGTLSFWDGKNYSLLQRIKSHDADILDIAVSADGQSIFSGGMDRRTTLYRRTGDERSGEKLRWAKMVHQRFHKHDVKAMATFETKALSVLASGGLDTAPIIIPIQQFGREYQRTLSNLPQQPSLRSAPRRRLMVSWWDREVSVWSIPKPLATKDDTESPAESVGLVGRKLVAKISLQGDEAITSADISSDGVVLAVSNVAELKFFQLRSKPGSIKVQKLEAPLDMNGAGARMIQISPDNKWLATVKTDNSTELHRMIKTDDPRKFIRFIPQTVHLQRLTRDPEKIKSHHGTLGNYNRCVSRLAFSADSRILALADNSGFLDTWVLEGHEDLTQEEIQNPKSIPKSASSDDEDNDEDSDDQGHHNVILGQHWIRNPTTSLLIKLPAAPLILSFRPSSTSSNPLMTESNPGVHSTRHTPNPHSHDLPNGEDRLLVLTAENQMYEFNVLSGKLSDWSRRNPPSILPQVFRDLKDRAMEAIWDVYGQNERIWIYGVSWLWMFDLSRDLPQIDIQESKDLVTNDVNGTKQLKRKREHGLQDDASAAQSRRDTGAGSKMATSELSLGIGRKIRKINGDGSEEAKLITLGQDQEVVSASEDENDYILAEEDDLALRLLPRNDQSGDSDVDDDTDIDAAASGDDDDRMMKPVGHERPSHWHTFKYRPIFGIVPLEGEPDDDAGGDVEDRPAGLEVALVERPLWDLDLPPQYYGNQEWDT